MSLQKLNVYCQPSMYKTLDTSFYKDPATIDPRKCGDAISSAAIFLLFKGLTRLQADHKIEFDLAESIHLSGDEKRYVFHLGEHYWSDGRPILASDIEYSWKTLLRPDFPSLSAHLFHPIKNAEKAKKGKVPIEKVGVYSQGPRTLIVELEHPIPYFLELISFCTFFPVPQHCQEQFSLLFGSSFVSSGPFQLVDWQQGKKILLKKNPLARNGFSVFLDQIQIHIIPDEKLAFSLFEKGEMDWIGEPFSPLPLNYLPALSENWENQPIGGVALCFFNTLQPPFFNQKLRQAFSYGIQREKLLRKLYLPHATAAEGLVPPILKANRQKAFISEADASLAKELFQQGLQELKKSSKGLGIVLSFEASELGFQIAQCLQKDWKEAFSLTVSLEPLEFKMFYDRLSKRQYTLAFTQWMAQYTDPMNILERFKDQEGGKNFSGWKDQEYRDLLERYLKQPNRQKRLDLIEQAEGVLMKQMPVAPIYYFSFSYLKQPYLKNLLFSPIGRVYLEQVYFDVKHQEVPVQRPAPAVKFFI